MKVQKYEIARVIDKLKSIVQKNDQFPALGGILVKDGYLIASNSEITMKVKLEASEGSYFIIPMKAFDLIKNLPDGEIDISATDKNVVMIKIGAIKNKYQSYPPEEFNFDITEDPESIKRGYGPECWNSLTAHYYRSPVDWENYRVPGQMNIEDFLDMGGGDNGDKKDMP